MRQRTRARGLAASILLLTAAVWLAPASWAADCTANINATLKKTEKKKTVTQYSWKLDVSSPDKCAKVSVNLVTTESEPGKDDQVVTTKKVVKVRGSSTSQKVSYDLPIERSLAHWEFKLAGCEVCEP